MIASLRAVRARVLRVLSTMSMYRLVVWALGVLYVYALLISLTGNLAATAVQLLVTLLALGAGAFAADLALHRLAKRALRWESTLITVLILVFVMRPTAELLPAVWLALAGVIAAASKFALAWRGRHVFNPAAVAAAVMTISWLSPAAWWVGTPILAPVVAILGMVVAWRTEKIRVVLVFVALAWIMSTASSLAAYAGAGLEVSFVDIAVQSLVSSPALFLGFFMLTEPLTLPPRRWQQFVEAAVVAFFVGYPVSIGVISLGSDRALLIGNLVAFAFALSSRRLSRVTLADTRSATPRVVELNLLAPAGATFTPGQYLELEVAHARPDQRGTRREFSILSAPADLPQIRVAYRESPPTGGSSFKRALGAAPVESRFAVTGVWGDFTLPAGGKVLLLAAGIGVTPFVSHVRQLAATNTVRDIAIVLVASAPEELAYREEFAAYGVTIFTKDDPRVRDNETWAQGKRIDAVALHEHVPDLHERHVLISGPPALIADLQPALAEAGAVTVDAFAGY